MVSNPASYSGSERAEAQTVLNQLFDCDGSNRQGVGALFVNRLTELNRRIATGENHDNPFDRADLTL
jgi:hypothetical protein